MNHYNRDPQESPNGNWDNTHADRGATNNWRDEDTGKPGTARIAGQIIVTPAKSNMDAALDAIKADLARGAKGFGV